MGAVRAGVVVLAVLLVTGCGGAEATLMPDVTGKQLDVAKSDIERAGIGDEVEVIGGGLFGVVQESNWQVCEQLPAAGEAVTDAPRLTVDRSCDDGSSSTATPTSTPEPDESQPSESAYAYAGPAYEVVIVDAMAGMGELDQYWIYTDKLSYSSDAYQDQVKLLIADVARTAGTDRLLVQVVTDQEIAEAEAVSTYEAFIAEKGSDYAMNTIPQKEKKGWVASYTGGIDYDAGELSDSDSAFVIDWFPASNDPESEMWKPVIAD